jgi:hypothetical protein
VFLVAAHIALGRFGPYLSSKELARAIAARARSEDKVMIYGDQAFGSSLLFYLRQDWAGRWRVLLFVPPHLKARVDGLLPAKFVIAEVSGKYVYSNRP